MSFSGAPVSKAVIIGLGGISLLAAASSRQYLFDIPLTPHITRDYQLWRFFIHHLAFTNSSELFVGILVLFYSSTPIERTFGSTKYASFLVAVTGLITALEIAALILFGRTGLSYLPAGPFAIIAAILYQSTRLTPTSFYWKVFGIEISNRVTFYVLSAQLFSSQPPTTIFVAFIGILASYLYRSNFLSLRTYRLSPRLILLFTKLFSPIMGSTTTVPRRSTVASFSDTLQQVGMSNILARAAMGPVTTNTPASTTTTTTTTSTTTTPSVPTFNNRVVVPPPRSGLVREWADGMTGGGGVRQPTAQQITELSAIFPETSRDMILAALQRNPDVARAAESLLAGTS